MKWSVLGKGLRLGNTLGSSKVNPFPYTTNLQQMTLKISGSKRKISVNESFIINPFHIQMLSDTSIADNF